MTILIPKEVENWFNKIRCPICKSRVVCNQDPVFYDSLYWIGGFCEMRDEYTVGCSFSDPRYIHLDDEEITFEFQDYEFQICKQITQNSIHNYINITGIYSGEGDITFQIIGNYFDFNNFDAEVFVQRINTLRTFQ